MNTKIIIKSPFDPHIGFSFMNSDQYDEDELHSSELRLISDKAVKKRRIEFCLGRQTAHEALKQIGIENFHVLKGKTSEPIWPNNVVGSISHTSLYATSAVAYKDNIKGIGIDIESLKSNINFDIASKICCDEELKWVNEINSESIKRLISIFSAKESIFKCLYPHVKKYFQFKDVILRWNKDTRDFSGMLLINLSDSFKYGYEFNVGVMTKEHIVFTYMIIY